jgi:hypothetical protein
VISRSLATIGLGFRSPPSLCPAPAAPIPRRCLVVAVFAALAALASSFAFRRVVFVVRFERVRLATLPVRFTGGSCGLCIVLRFRPPAPASRDLLFGARWIGVSFDAICVNVIIIVVLGLAVRVEGLLVPELAPKLPRPGGGPRCPLLVPRNATSKYQ